MPTNESRAAMAAREEAFLAPDETELDALEGYETEPEMKTAKTWTRAEINEILDENDAAVIRGLLIIDGFQTATERACQATIDRNGIGWSGFDANFASSLASFARSRGRLSARQLVFARKLVKKHSRQLVLVANGELSTTVDFAGAAA